MANEKWGRSMIHDFLEMLSMMLVDPGVCGLCAKVYGTDSPLARHRRFARHELP